MAEYIPSRMISHVLTAYAVQASVQFVCNEFLKRFIKLDKLPIMFYDWQQGFAEQLKQALAKIPQQDRNRPWFTILYNYGAAKPNPIQPRPIPDVFRQLGYLENGDPIATELECRFSQVPVVCDIITNDSNYADSLAQHRMLRQSYWESFEYQDVLYPTWKPRMNAYYGMYMLSNIPNGCFYQCSKAGVTGRTEPKWPVMIGQTIKDGDAIWDCVSPKMAKASVSHHTLPELTTATTYDSGIRYQIRFGYGLNYVALEDLNNIVSGLITLENYVYSQYDLRDLCLVSWEDGKPLPMPEELPDKHPGIDTSTNDTSGYDVI